MNGIVKVWRQQGWGFASIYDSDGNVNGDVFIHYSDIQNRDSLEVGDEITFDIEETSRGKKAKNVVVID